MFGKSIIVSLLVLLLGLRYVDHFLTMPGVLLGTIALFYLVLLETGMSIDDAINQGLLLGEMSGEATWQPLVPKNLLAANWANGSLAEARRLTQGGGMRRRRWLLETLAELEGRPASVVLALAESLSQKKERLPEDLQCMRFWLRDLLVHQFAPDEVVNQDLIQKIGDVHEAGSSA